MSFAPGHEIRLFDFTRAGADKRSAYRWRVPELKPAGAPHKGRGFYSSSRDAFTLDEQGSSFRLRLEQGPEIGFHPDADRSETFWPVIARLPKGRGFLAGWTMGAGMCGSLDGRIYTEEEAARSAAEAEASDAAEAEAESKEAYQARERFDAAGEELEQLRVREKAQAAALEAAPEWSTALAETLEKIQEEADALELERANLESAYGSNSGWER